MHNKLLIFCNINKIVKHLHFSQVKIVMIKKANILCFQREKQHNLILPFYPQSQQYHHQPRLHYHDLRRLVPMALATTKCINVIKLDFK